MTLFGFDISGIVLILKVIGFILSLGFGIGIIISLLNKKEVESEMDQKHHDHFHVYQSAKNPHIQRWNMVEQHMKSQNPAEWRMGIIDADTMLEDMITGMGYQGGSFGEKLKSINPAQFPNLQLAWEVHKVRNRIAHDGQSFQLSERDAYQAFKTYEQLLRGGGYIG